MKPNPFAAKQYGSDPAAVANARTKRKPKKKKGSAKRQALIAQFVKRNA